MFLPCCLPKYFFLILSFQKCVSGWLVDFIGLILFRVHAIYWICRFIFCQIEGFSATTWVLFQPQSRDCSSPSWTLITWISRVFVIISPVSSILSFSPFIPMLSPSISFLISLFCFLTTRFHLYLCMFYFFAEILFFHLSVLIILHYNGYFKIFFHNSNISVILELASLIVFFIQFEIFLVLGMMTKFLLITEYIGYSLMRFASDLNLL